MARQPKPWYWKARGAWYVQLDGKQVKLHEDKRRAEQEFYRLMASRGELDGRQRANVTVADACEALLAQVQVRRPSTRRHYTENLGRFASAFGGRRLANVSVQEVLQWVASYDSPEFDAKGRPLVRRWGEHSRAMQYRYVRQLYRWARDTGLIDVNPFARVEGPWTTGKRDRPMSATEYEAILADTVSSDEFKEIVEFVWRVGARPGELAILSAQHLDASKMIARLQPTEHKTGTRTGAQREIHFPPDLWERLKRYTDIRPSGPLLRRKNGEPWRANIISAHFGRAKKRLGLTCVLYQARHSYFTTLADNGVPAARAAKLGGHRSLNTFMSTYYHPEVDLMQQDVRVTADAEIERMEQIRQKVEEARAAEEAARAERRAQIDAKKHERWNQKRRQKRADARAAREASDPPPEATTDDEWDW